MEQYVSKSAIIAEIKKRRDAALMRQQNLESIGQDSVINEMVANELKNILSFINTIEPKEVDLDKEIEKEIETRWRGEYLFTTKFKESAKHFFELGLKAKQH